MHNLEKTVILYIEDDPGMAHIVRKRLEKNGYFIELAETGKKGIEKFDKKVHDLVISDFRLPDMDGCQIIKTLTNGSGLPPTVILTGAGNEKIAVEALKMGAADYLVKDANQIFLELLPTVIESALFTKKLLEENKMQQEKLNYYMKELEERNKELDKLAHFDSLTNLANRVVFQDNMIGAMARANRSKESMALLMIDLDGFKGINDSYGHVAGDLLLKEIANRFKHILRDSDHIARIGGDEFAVILEGLDNPQDANIVAAKLISQLCHPVLIESEEVKIMASIGIATYPACGENVTGLLKSADTAMYLAKKEYGNSYQFFTEELNNKAVESARLEKDLEMAIKNNELLLHFQPKYSRDAKIIVGAEALLRWNHPKKGSIPPDVFIPVAEKSSLINKIGLWVIRRACRQGKEWLDNGIMPMMLSVNVSPHQLRQSDFAEQVLDAINVTGFDPNFLQIEITETSLVKNLDRCRESLIKLRKHGVKVSIDDFGIGYSSIAHLRDLPIDELKIDRSVISCVTKNDNEAAIATAIINLAHNLKLTVVAEGVETREQMEFLQSRHCDALQGYYLNKPMPANELTGFIEKKVA